MIYLIILVLLFIAELIYFCIANQHNIIDKPNELITLYDSITWWRNHLLDRRMDLESLFRIPISLVLSRLDISGRREFYR